ncbi:HGL315Wp [Eremothecium sinecaudum]|uniref:Very long-chain fatty acid transport protein n=1 Tax=Eremothecium sinecaudum TaxID=45286 RepID=A0A0X8HV92_9SACH|nr:HGL315Wp [Eremothecium sinecaudum]AMD22025.1 HGL315Wp [Eremothecium sinecaudum]
MGSEVPGKLFYVRSFIIRGAALLRQLVVLVFSATLTPLIYLFDILDQKHRIRDDWYIIKYFLCQVLIYLWQLTNGKFQNWYLFEKQAFKYGQYPCISYTRPLATKGEFKVEMYTYRETYDIVLKLSNVLFNDYGVRPGDHIALDYTNKPMFIFLWLALWNLGATPAFINYNQLGQPLVHSIKITNVKQVFIDPQASGPIKKTEDDIKKEVPEIQLHYIDEDSLLKLITSEKTPTLRMENKLRSPTGLSDFDAAMLIYTSGTTGLPKSAIISWRKASIGCTLFGHIMRIKPNSVVLTAMPLYHSTAALLGACAAISQGGCVAISNKFSVSTFWKEAYLTKTTHIQYVGEVCRYLLNSPKSEYEDKHRVKVAYGNGLRPGIWMEFKRRFNIDVIGEFYASTEAPFATTSFQRGDFGVGACRNYGTIINWFLACEQTLVKMDAEDDSVVYRDPNGLCKMADVDQPGELLMRIFMSKKPETSFQGYLGNKKATESKVLRNVFRKGDAWYRSGDLLKADKDGLWYFVDRLGDSFRWKSENVSATEVENQILKFSKDVFECVIVLGMKIPQHEGKAGFAVIQLKDDFQSINRVELLNELLEHLNNALPKYALPIFVKFVPHIETTHNHKLPKKEYKNQKFPSGESGDETIYWLKEYKEYKVLEQSDWDLITSGKMRL